MGAPAATVGATQAAAWQSPVCPVNTPWCVRCLSLLLLVSYAACIICCLSRLLWSCVPAPEGLVTAKGRVAAELNVGHDELVLTELILGGAFADIPPDALAALCSCFVWSERAMVPPK